MRIRPFRICAALVAVSLVAACGGGGGGGGSSGGSIGPLFNQWGLRTVGADRAYAELERVRGDGTKPGDGQTVGIIDTGIDEDHPFFSGKTISERFLEGATNEDGSEISHGTAVASVIMARPSDADAERTDAARGVAWGADVAMFAIPVGSGGATYVPISLTGLNAADDRWAARIEEAIDWTSGGRSLDFVNVSIAFNGIVDLYTEQQLRDNFGDTISNLAQTGNADKVVFVFAAGNAHGDPCDPNDFTGHSDLCVVDTNGEYRVNARSVEVLAGLTTRIQELRGHMLAVVAIGPNGRIASFSNRCGIAADWCLAAPGVRVEAAYFGPHPDNGTDGARGTFNPSGTSFSAPMVVGGLVVMKHYFRDTMSNTELVTRLLETANKRGIYANSAIYGQGLMDLGAATRPVGNTSIVRGNRVNDPGSNVQGTRFTPGGPLGNSLTQALAGHEIVAFDALGAPFWFSLGDLAGAASGPSLTARLRSFMAPARPGAISGPLQPERIALTGHADAPGPASWRLGMMGTPRMGAGGGHLSLAGRAMTLGTRGRDGFGVSAFSTEGMKGQMPVSGATLSWQPTDSPLALTSGVVAERETMLGSTTSGAFGRVSGSSTFAGIEGNTRIGAWQMSAGAELGTVNAAARGGLISDVTPLATSAFALRAERKLGDRDALLVSVGQPLRVEAGRAKLSIPVGRTKDGRVLRRSFTADLKPSGRQIDIAAQWRRPLGDGTEMRLGASWSRRPGHDASAGPDLSLLAAWRHAF